MHCSPRRARGGWDAVQRVRRACARRAQNAALGSRLGIPLAFTADVIHGCRMIFPIPLAEAADFDPALAERAARAVAGEAGAAGLHWTFAPMIDIARDQRWGRVAEGAGEDVMPNRLLAAARVRGFQGGDLRRRPDGLLAASKHLAGYSAVRGGMEYGAVDLSDAELRETFLPPFQAASAAGAGATIASFHQRQRRAGDRPPRAAHRPVCATRSTSRVSACRITMPIAS